MKFIDFRGELFNVELLTHISLSLDEEYSHNSYLILHLSGTKPIKMYVGGRDGVHAREAKKELEEIIKIS